MRRFVRLACVLALATLAPARAAACGVASDCPVAGGSYRIRLPAGATSGLLGAIVYFHGWRGNSAEAMSDEALTRVADRLGVALVAPDGEGGRWTWPSLARRGRDDFAFVDAVLADVVARFPVDRSRMLATGFSLGGSMVWTLACDRPDRFMAYAPVAGAFWLPTPTACAAPAVRLFHLHGRADATVPMTGRRVSSGAQQGDVRASFALICPPGPAQPQSRPFGAVTLACERFAGCRAPGAAELCLHEGGHVFSADWVAYAWTRTMALIGATSP